MPDLNLNNSVLNGLGLTEKLLRKVMRGYIWMYYNMPVELRGKTIQKGYRFLVTIIPNKRYFKRLVGSVNASNVELTQLKSTIKSNTALEQMDTLDMFPMSALALGWYVSDVKLPLYNITREKMNYGVVPRTYPIFGDSGEGQAVEPIEINFEDDERNTINYFINWGYKTIINKDGTHVPPNWTKLFNIAVVSFGDNAFPSSINVYTNCYFGGGSALNYNYGSEDKVIRNVKFYTDRIGYINLNYILSGLTSEFTSGQFQS